MAAIDPSGKALPVEVIQSDPQNNWVLLRLLAENVPATGYKLIRLEPQGKSPAAKPTLIATADSLENEFVRLKVDPKTGCITSLFDKRSNTEALALPVQSEGSPGGVAGWAAVRQPAAGLRGQAQALGRMER